MATNIVYIRSAVSVLEFGLNLGLTEEQMLEALAHYAAQTREGAYANSATH